MKRIQYYTTVVFVLVGLIGLDASDGTAISVEGRKILLNGERFMARGVCYQPTPIGEDPTQSPPYGDYFTADYEDLYNRDVVQMRAMGVNLVRNYAWTPGADHTRFLDALFNGGEQPIRMFINRWIDPETDWSDESAVAKLVDEYLAIADEVKGHPAVLGFLIGNETNAHHGNGAKPAFWQAMNRIAKALKAHSPDRLVSIAITDALAEVSRYDATMADIDAWSIQVYRGLSFGNFYDEYAAVSEKPLIVTEFGVDAFDAIKGEPYANNGQFVADAVGEMLVHMWERSDISSGGCIFEFGDEWWKSKGSPSEQDAGGFDVPGYPDKMLNEEWWGIFEVVDNGDDIDIIKPRQLFFTLQSMWALPRHQKD